MSKDFDASQSSKGVPRDYKTATPYSSRPSQGITPELLSLVKRTALHLKGRLPKSVEVDDLMQSVLEELIQAMDSFAACSWVKLQHFGPWADLPNLEPNRFSSTLSACG